MDSECIKIDPQNNESTQPDEVESVEREVGDKRKRKERSIVWNFFDKDEKGAVKGSKKVPCKCKKCNTIFMYDSIQGMGNLKRHMEKCFSKNYHDVGQMLFNSDMALRSSRFDQNIFRDLLVVATVRHELPLSFVDYKGIRDLAIKIFLRCLGEGMFGKMWSQFRVPPETFTPSGDKGVASESQGHHTAQLDVTAESNFTDS
ncbi:zinc finger, BED-type [Artemisia annua]|uniref:Zinc finger, BED-type n=1 Tax=Artemisia annua TaxID=35608 RepID=A0A2U1LS87_ARTAN|nr:zinc finger, BED-type [Artemisia annua]